MGAPRLRVTICETDTALESARRDLSISAQKKFVVFDPSVQLSAVRLYGCTAVRLCGCTAVQLAMSAVRLIMEREGVP